MAVVVKTYTFTGDATGWVNLPFGTQRSGRLLAYQVRLSDVDDGATATDLLLVDGDVELSDTPIDDIIRWEIDGITLTGDASEASEAATLGPNVPFGVGAKTLAVSVTATTDFEIIVTLTIELL